MTEAQRVAAIALYDRFTHEGMERRAFFSEMVRIAGGVAAANALIGAIAADPAAAAVVAADDRRVKGAELAWQTVGRRTMKGYLAQPAGTTARRASVVLVHENRGLTEHIRDVARRVALAGYNALAPDFLSGTGGTPADQDAARAAIGKLDLAQSAADAAATLALLKSLPGANGRVAAIGFCWGGGMVNRLAVAAGPALHAGVPFYGPAPDPALAPRVEAAMLLHYAERDERVNATGLPWAEPLKAAGRNVQSFVYPGVEHAFHNDTSAERYNAAAARLSWQRTLDFLAATIGAKV